jgi:DNA-binding CsgD family transcriptional regulator
VGGAVTPPPLVGRERELAALTDAIADAARGHGGVVLLSGEPGIGKSRLAAETVGQARRRGFTVVEGRADPLLSTVPYAPIVQALRRHLISMTDTDPALVARLAPDLDLLFPDLRHAVPAAGDAELRRTRMYESVLALVTRMATRHPVLLCFDDLHCADHATVELLHYVGRNAGDLPVLVLGCHWSGDTGDALDMMAAATRRDPRGRHLDLTPLTERAVAALVHGTTAAVSSRAAGVPLFALALAESGGALPEVVRDVVLDRIGRLDPARRRLLDVVAVAGSSARSHVLRTVSGLSGPELAASLHRLVTSGLVGEHRCGAEVYYRVRHPLYAEVVYAELGACGQRALHAAVGAAVDGPEHTPAVARHYAAAGEDVPADRAIPVLGAAGRHALSVGDADDAARYLATALRRARDVRSDLVPDLLADLAGAQQARGRLDESADLLAHAATAGESRGQEVGRRQAWLRTLELLNVERGTAGNMTPPLQLVTRWLIAARLGDLPELELVAKEMAANGDSPAAQSVARPDTGTPAAQSVARLGAGTLAALSGDLAAACAALAPAVELAQLCGEDAASVAFAPRLLLSGLSVVRGDVATAVRAVDVDTAAVRFPAAGCYLRTTLALARYVAGSLPSALADADVAVAEAERVGQDRLISRTLAVRATLRAEAGDVPGATADVTAARRRSDDTQPDSPYVLDLAGAAVALLRGTPAEAPPCTGTPPFGEPLLTCLRMVVAGRIAVGDGDVLEAARLTDVLRSAGRDAPLADALADRQQGLTAAMRGDQATAVASLRSAATALNGMGAALLAAQAELELAELLPGPEAATLIRSAAMVFTANGARPWSDRATQLARTNRIPLSHLTRRETEITELVGAGMSNADVASRLFLSERTVETHLRNIYRKLNLKSRINLAHWSQRNHQ